MIDYGSVLSKRAVGLAPSGIRRFFDILEEMKDVISLGVGEPDFVTPGHIRAAGIESLKEGYTKYTSNAGMVALRKEISSYLERRFHIKYAYDDQICITVGGSEAIDLVIRALVDPGDEVIIPTPSFVCYGPLVTLAGGVPVEVETKVENGFRLMPQELKAAITPKTKLLVLPYPSNPTGGIMERADLEALAGILKDTNIIVLSDEIYAELTYGQDHVSMASIPGMYECTLVVSGFSKAFAMTGWRLGYVCGAEKIIQEITKIHQFGIMSAPTISQFAGIEALRNGMADPGKMRESYDKRRRFMVDGFRRIGLECFEPQGAFYAFPCIRSSGLSSDKFSERLLMEEKIAVIAGNAFGGGGEGFVRCCYAASMENIAEALKRMERFLAKLRREQGRSA
ncbi:MAG: aminotransferase class I/II-fold pyridoxal phosphate-dependent enzyme [Oscillospiraceae bacterium]|nr:aminotransferase class I/II-fold pyridoxal phosphate-dependent enzyme [Oscillospiraceae bacterium]